MLSDRKEKLLVILSKFPQTQIDATIAKIKSDSLTLNDFFIQINIKDEMEKCKKDFLNYHLSYLNYYLTLRTLHEVNWAKEDFFLAEMDEKPETTTLDSSKLIPPIHLYSLIPLTKTFRHNAYWDIYNDIKDVHCIAYREPHFKSFTETTIKFNSELCHLINHHDSNYLYLYLLANLHHHLNMFFDPKVRSKLSLILDAFKDNRFNITAEIYVAKNLLMFIKRMLNPEFADIIKNTDFAEMIPFKSQLQQNFPEFHHATPEYKKICKKIYSKEWDATTKLLNIDGRNKALISKSLLKIAALDYFRDLIMSEKDISKDQIRDAMTRTFGKHIFDTSFIGRTHLEKRINEWDAIAHPSKSKFFQEEKNSKPPVPKVEFAELKCK